MGTMPASQLTFKMGSPDGYRQQARQSHQDPGARWHRDLAGRTPTAPGLHALVAVDTRSFAALGGVAHRGIYDNMKTAVDKGKKGKGRIVNERFATMCAHYLYDPDFCNVVSGWEKRVVEKNEQDSRRRVWIDASQIKFSSFSELNAWLGQLCRALWDEVRHPEHTYSCQPDPGPNNKYNCSRSHRLRGS